MDATSQSKPAATSERLRALWPLIGELVRPRRGLLAIGFGLMVVNRLSGLVLPASTKFLIDDIIAHQRQGLLVPLVLAVLLATALQGATSFALTQLLSKAGQRLIAELRQKVRAHIGRLPVAYYDATKSGAMVSRIMTDVEGVRNLLGTGLVELLGGLLTAVFALGILMRISPVLTGLAMAFVLAFALVLRRSFRTVRPIFRARGKINAEVTGRLTESLGGVRVVKGYRAEAREEAVFARGVQRLLDNVLQSLTVIAGMSLSGTLFMGMVGAVVMYVGAREIFAGTLTLGGFVTFTALLAFLVAPVFQVVSIGTQLSEALAGLERTRDPSGAGKSTIIGLVAAFYAPTDGVVRVDGVDLSTVRLGAYRTQLGVVLQETFLFDGTIRENVAFARPEATDAEVLDACRIARVDEFAEQFERRYETLVGERGVKLSGGQRQRVSIARAILADPRILILDEATSSLDSESEASIQAGLAHLMRGRTTFVIAHRLSTVRRADQILVIEAGRIVERGTHESLLAAHGRYFDLYTRQHGLETNLLLGAGEGDEAVEGEPLTEPKPPTDLGEAIRLIRE
ncbi:MAG: transporter related [candidate division NC10 bacterium]|nr:transporter related [candidate division NC10 bacterium]